MKIKDTLEKVLRNDSADSGNIENISTTSNNNKVKLVWKILVIAMLGAGVALGCCDLDCVSMHLADIFGL